MLDLTFDDLENSNNLARRELTLLEVLARLASDIIGRRQSELFSRYERAIHDCEGDRFKRVVSRLAPSIGCVDSADVAALRTTSLRS